jgi:hypothetical protein
MPYIQNTWIVKSPISKRGELLYRATGTTLAETSVELIVELGPVYKSVSIHMANHNSFKIFFC